uniref:Bm402 n=1 Tax=Brugia malayi TaxID=6279 RepID=A0A1I9GEB0_BRUMA|nr:Bm402 [Brugia malayi]
MLITDIHSLIKMSLSLVTLVVVVLVLVMTEMTEATILRHYRDLSFY